MSNDQNQNPSQAINIVSVESLINSHQLRLDTLQKELKEQKSMLDSLLENNDEYQLALEQHKKFTKIKTLEKQKALKDSNTSTLLEKVRDCQAQVRELKIALSDYLSQYVALSGTNKLEAPDGTILNIVYTAKLVKDKSSNG